MTSPDDPVDPPVSTPTDRAARRERQKAAREAWRNTGVGWRVLPRTLLGICLTLLVLGVGAGMSGAVLFAYYDASSADNQAALEQLSDDIDRQARENLAALEDAGESIDARAAAALGPYRELLQNADGVSRVSSQIASSVAVLTTRDPEGREVAGTATAVGEDNGETLLVTSLSLVRAGTADPRPPITLSVGAREWQVTLWTWDEDLDVAVLRGPTDLQAAPLGNQAAAGSLTGAPVFAISGLDATASPGTVVAVSASGLRYLAALGRDFAGGPLLAADGTIVGFVTPGYVPGGLDGELRWSPGLAQLCETVLTCDGVDS